MKFISLKEKVENFIKISEFFTGKNLELESLSCLKLKTEKNNLNIQATNIDSAININIPVKTIKEGEILISVDVFVKIILNIENEEIVFEKKDNFLIIETKKTKTEINLKKTEDFPSVPEIKKEIEEDFLIDKEDFIQGLKSVYFSASNSNIKPELSSVFLNFKEDNIFFVATDGRRLSEKIIKNNKKIKKETSFLIPTNSVLNVIKTFEIFNNIKEISIFIFEDHIFLKHKNFEIFLRLTDGNFPDYKKIIPEENETSLVLLKNDLLNVFKINNIFLNEFNEVVLYTEKNFLILETKGNLGTSVNKLDVVIDGENIKYKFNQKYIIEVFNSLKEDSVEFVFNKNKPLKIKNIGDKTFTYIVMPIEEK